MIIVHANGQLGNQIVLLLAAHNMAARREWIIAVNFHQTAALFSQSSRFFWVGSGQDFSLLSRLLARLIRYVEKIPAFLQKHFLTFLSELPSGAIASSLPRATPFRPITWIKDVYLQHSCFLDLSGLDDMPLRSIIQLQSKAWLRQRSLDHTPLIFVHLRRGDYLSWSPFPASLSGSGLPLGYYFQSLDRILSLIPSATVLIASDDLDYAKTHFSNRKDILFVDEDPLLTFGLLCRCSAGVLSPSTFSWAAAAFATKSGASGPFIAPLYWLGFHHGVPYPQFLHSSFLSYTTVL